MNRIVLLVGLLLLSACSSDEREPKEERQQPVQQQIIPQQQYAPSPQPLVIQQAPDHSSGMQDMLIGGLIGHSLASSGSNGLQRTIVNKTVINRTVVRSRPSRSSYRKR